MPESQNGSQLSESEEVLARGQSMLERLAREAEAARAEARCAELEQILLDARRRGDPGHLKRWLDHYERGNAEIPAPHYSPSFASTVPEPAAVAPTKPEANQPHAIKPELHYPKPTEEQRAALKPESLKPESLKPAPNLSTINATEQVTSWEQVLPVARQRLAARAAELGPKNSSAETPKSSSTDAPTLQPVNATSKPTLAGKPHTRDAKANPNQKSESITTTLAGTRQKAKAQVDKQPSPQPNAVAGAVNVASLVKEIDPELLKQQQQELAQQQWRSKLRGMLVSLAVHVLLVVLLAMMAIKLPSPPASLAFESSASEATESFEMTQPLEVSTPAEVSEAVPNPEMSVDLSDTLSDLSATTSSSAEGLLSAAPSLAAAAMAAVNAGGAKPPAMRADSSFFGADASGNNFCYVIDSSGSMRAKSAWEAAKGELLRSLSTLKESQRFYIIFFNSELDAIPLPGQREPAPSALYATQENIEHARRWVDTIRLDQGAAPTRALEVAVELEPDAIYLLTDGVTKVDVPQKVRAFNRVTDFINGEQVRVPIHAIAYFSLEGENLMKQLAAENNGQFIYVPAPAPAGKSSR